MRASFPLLALAILAPCLAGAQERRPDAELTLLRGQVEVLAPEARPAQRGQALERGQRVSTAAGAAAEVTFSDGARVRLGERSLLLVAGDPAGVRHGATDTTLQSGSLRATVPGGRGAPVVVLATPAAHARLGEGEGVLSVDEWQTTWAAAHRGAWRVTAAGKTVRVREGYAVRVGLGRAPGAPQRLPARPAWQQAPQDAEGGTLTVSWQAGAAAGSTPASWHVEVARDERFSDVAIDRRQPAKEASLALADLQPGRYLLRVAAVDADLLEGEPLVSSSFVITVARRPAPAPAPVPPAQAAPSPAPAAPSPTPAQAPAQEPVLAQGPAAEQAPAAEPDAEERTAEPAEQSAEPPGGDEARGHRRRGVAPELGIMGGLFLGNIGSGSMAGGVSVELGFRFRLPVGSLALALRPSYEHADFSGGAESRELLTLTATVAWRLRGPERAFVPYLLLAPQFHFDWLRGPAGADLETQPGLLAAAGAQFRVGGGGALFFEGGYRLASDPRRRSELLRGEVLTFGYRHAF